jgi:hypothetical protein
MEKKIYAHDLDGQAGKTLTVNDSENGFGFSPIRYIDRTYTILAGSSVIINEL